MFQTKIVEEMETHIYIQNALFKNSFVCEIMWKNMVDPDRPQVSIWRMRIRRWIT